MTTALSWKSSFSGTECRIFRGKVIAGLLKTSAWKNEGYGELDGHMLKFKTKGFFQKQTEILDIEGVQVLGNIEYNLFKNSAWITYEGSRFKWQYDSWLRSKWSVSAEPAVASFSLKGFWKNEGEVSIEDIPPAVILASFFVKVYFNKVAAAA